MVVEYITRQAFMRGRYLLGLDRGKLFKRANKAFKDGMLQPQTKGATNTYLEKLRRKHYTSGNIRLHKGVIYIFIHTSLVMVYKLPDSVKQKKT